MSNKTHYGFTIVELLVVIVVIGILAAITMVSYTGISQKAKEATLQSDLSNASTQIKLFQATEPSGNYPTANTCPTPGTTEICLKPSNGNTYTYTPNNASNPKTFALTNTNTNGTAYGINDTSSPIALAQPTDCPTGFIPVPGSATYGTVGFCVMKYAASQVGATNVPASVPSVQPWVYISQTTAIANSPNVVGCTGCHLITEAEWMTIAQNVLGIASNWDNGAGVHTVGTGFIYSGHNDNAPSQALATSTDDTDGYFGTGNTTGSTQRRTLTLSNGEVIWDMAGNVYEWTSGTSTTGQPGVAGNAYASSIRWPNVTTPGTLSPNVFPSGTGIAGSSTWSNGIGRLASNPAETSLRGFFRGGHWGMSGYAGVLALCLYASPSYTTSFIGFRVSR